MGSYFFPLCEFSRIDLSSIVLFDRYWAIRCLRVLKRWIPDIQRLWNCDLFQYVQTIVMGLEHLVRSIRETRLPS